MALCSSDVYLNSFFMKTYIINISGGIYYVKIVPLSENTAKYNVISSSWLHGLGLCYPCTKIKLILNFPRM